MIGKHAEGHTRHFKFRLLGRAYLAVRPVILPSALCLLTLLPSRQPYLFDGSRSSAAPVSLGNHHSGQE